SPRPFALRVCMNHFDDLAASRSAEEIAAPSELALDVPALAERLAHPEVRMRPTRQLHRLKLWRLFGFARDRMTGKYVPLRWGGARGESPAAKGGPPTFLDAIT